jgi:hypothetical protein
LDRNLKDSQQRVKQLETQLIKDTACSSDVVDIGVELQETRQGCIRLQEAIRRKRAGLGVRERTTLQRIQHDAFLQLRVNARAIKTRIRDRLRQRKFELERLERSYRQAVNGKSYVVF